MIVKIININSLGLASLGIKKNAHCGCRDVFIKASACIFLKNLGDGLLGAGRQVVAIEFRDVVCTNFLGADGFAFVLVGAVAESLGIHLPDHREGPGIFLDLSLGKVIQMGGLC